MPLAAGQSLSFYEILGPLGAGGMGEVFRARDTRLEREVAIKVLPDEMADDGERLRRFEREAKTLASLNHPNVAGIHGVDQDGEVCFLALELVPGEDLEARLAGGALPLDEALDVCRQIAEGLEAAHEAGVVHRDLKPANVRVTPEGIVKVLDFGLAKPIGPESSKSGTESSQSDSFLVTSEGMILGTPTYMSPEQARGRAVDKRTDIWAFGCVLYECLTGTRAFVGDAFGDLIASILQNDADLDALPAGTPAHVRELLERCLVKDPRRRLRDLGEARLLLDPSFEAPQVEEPRDQVPPRRATPVLGVAAVLVGLGAGGLGWALRGGGDAPEPRWSRFTQLTDLAGAETSPSLSPDGGTFAYASRAAGSWDVYVQRVGGRHPTAIAADPERDETWPAFSPDGSRLAYCEADGDGGIWVVGATGESRRRVTDFGFQPAWSPDGEHLAFTSGDFRNPYEAQKSHVFRVPVDGGEPVQLSTDHAYQPAWSPSGERIAIWFQENGQRDLVTLPANGGERVLVLDDAPLDWSPTWSPDGRALLFSSDRGGSLGLWRIAIDEATGRATGAPEFVLGGLESSAAQPSFSADGTKLAFRSETVTITPWVLPFDPVAEEVGTPRELVQRTGILRPSGVSPDGSLLVLDNRGGHRQEDLFLMRTDGTELRRLTDDVARDRGASFTADGASVLFHSNRDGPYASYSIRLDGSGRTALTDESLGNIGGPSIRPGPEGGGRLLARMEFFGWCVFDGPFPVSSESRTRLPDLSGPTGVLTPSVYSLWSWSPDGRFLVGVVEDVSHTPAGIAVHDVTSGEGRLVTSDEAPCGVRFLPDSRRLVYLSGSHDLVVFDIETGERRSIPVNLPQPPTGESFALAADGTAIYFGVERIESSVWLVEPGA